MRWATHIVLAGLTLAATAPAGPQHAPATTGPVPASTITLRISPIIDLHMMLRAQPEQEELSHPAIAGLPEAIAAIKRFETSLGGPRAWLSFEGNFLDCQTAADVKKIFGRLPERIGPRDLRQPALDYAAALEKIEPAFIEQQWPQRRQRLEQSRELIERDFMPHSHDCLKHIIASLGMTDPGVSIPVHLTIDGPSPGASTSATVENRGVVFVALNSATGTQLFETIAHEATHALDVATRNQQHALNVMRQKLVDSGVPRTDRRWRDAWHTIMFITAADAVRHAIDPQHEDYGVVEKYYDKVSEVAAIERPIWAEYLRGAIPREQAIDRIVEAIAALAPTS